MKAIYLSQKAGPEALQAGDIPMPHPNANEVLVRVHATSVMPSELGWTPTFSTPTGGPRPFPVVLSHDLSGVVEAVGAQVQNWTAGDAVFGINDWFANGAQAEYCIAPATALARKPRSLNDAQAAVVPISALTAWQGLFDKGNLKAGERVLIHGAAGGAGSFAVQLARCRGAHVIATASSANADFVGELGANQVIDYHHERFEDLVENVDLVFDTVGGDTLERSLNVLRNGGVLVTIVTPPDQSVPKVRDAFMLVEADGQQLAVIADFIDSGLLRVFLGDVFPLEQAREAYQCAGRRHVRGKVALLVADSMSSGLGILRTPTQSSSRTGHKDRERSPALAASTLHHAFWVQPTNQTTIICSIPL